MDSKSSASGSRTRKNQELSGVFEKLRRMGLTEDELAVLRFETRRYRVAGAKEVAIRAELDMTAWQYYQVLNALVDNPDALQLDPLLVNALARRRARARHQRRSPQPPVTTAAAD